MEISQTKSDDLLVIALAGRLDANWCGHVENTLLAAVRSGEHRIHLDLGAVPYISSAGLRVLLSAYKQLRAIKGSFIVVNPSAAARGVLDLAGLGMIVSEEPTEANAAPTHGREERSTRARYELFGQLTKSPLKLASHGDAAWLSGLSTVSPAKQTFGPQAFALGVGALGTEEGDSASRYGEFLAIAGTAAFQPSDGSSRPDFVLSEGSLIPEGFLPLGLSGTGTFDLLARFEAEGTVGLTELAKSALSFAEAPTVAIVALTETAGLIGAALRKSPTSATATEEPLGFPQIRDWLSFTTERAYRDTTSLIVGVVSQNPHPLLRPMGEGLQGHFHAASFPYRPLQKGRIELPDSVQALFEAHNLQAVLHLLTDSREFSGSGESEFLRGALWISPAHLDNPTT